MLMPLALWYLRLAIYYTVAIATCGYAARRGGGPERAIAWLILVGSLASTLVPRQNWDHVVASLALIDGVALIGFGAVALTADRYWPLPVSAFQVLTVALHGVRAYDPTILPAVYARLEGELIYPILILLTVGTRRHVRRGFETDWSWQVRREPGGRPSAAGDQR